MLLKQVSHSNQGIYLIKKSKTNNIVKYLEIFVSYFLHIISSDDLKNELLKSSCID